MRGTALWAGLALLAGCEAAGPGFELIPETVLPSFDCDDPELRPTIAPLRARLLGNLGTPAAGTPVQLDAAPRGFVRVFDSRAVEALQSPFEEPWQGLVDDGQIWLEFSGDVDTVNAAPLGELTTSSLGAVEAWVHVDLPRICDDGLTFEAAVVTLSAGTLSEEFVLTYVGQQ